MPRVVNMLTGVKTAEVSLVRRGANNKRIALTKGITMDELLKSVLGTPAEGEEKLVETLTAEGQSEEAIELAKANFRLQSGFQDKLSAEAFGRVLEASGLAKSEPEEKKEEKEDDSSEEEKKEEKTEKSHVPADMPEEVKKAWDAQQEELSALRKAAQASEEKIENLEKAAIRKEFVAKCEKEYSHVPGMTAEEMADTLLSVSKEVGARLEKQWADTSKALQESSLLKAEGQLVLNDAVSGSPVDQLNQIAKSLQAEDSSLSAAKAFDLALQKNPALYEEYKAQHPAHKGR